MSLSTFFSFRSIKILWDLRGSKCLPTILTSQTRERSSSEVKWPISSRTASWCQTPLTFSGSIIFQPFNLLDLLDNFPLKPVQNLLLFSAEAPGIRHMTPEGLILSECKEKIALVFLHSSYVFQYHACSRGLFLTMTLRSISDRLGHILPSHMSQGWFSSPRVMIPLLSHTPGKWQNLRCSKHLSFWNHKVPLKDYQPSTLSASAREGRLPNFNFVNRQTEA